MESSSAEFPGLNPDPRASKAIHIVRRLSYFLDEKFRIPGTRVRFGWDPLIGLIPGFGDLLGALASLFIVMQAFRLGVPNIIKARMVLNVLIDMIVGAIPLVGDIFDFVWKSNSLNLYLLEKHAGTASRPGIGDWAFVLGTVAAALIIIAIPILLAIFLATRLQNWLRGSSIWNV